MTRQTSSARAAGRPPAEESLDATAWRILMVCLGNHCRSPFAAAVIAQLGGAAVDARSAGVSGRWAGQPAHPAMVTAAARLGYDLSGHRGVQVSPALMQRADLILAMDSANLAALRGLADGRTASRLALYLGDQDVPDPWGLPDDAFIECAEIIAAGARRYLR